MFETVNARRAHESQAADVAQLRDAILGRLTYSIGKDAASAGSHDWFMACALAVRDRVIDQWMHSTRQTYTEQKKRVYYLSVEFLLGRLLFDTLGNLGITETAREALAELGVDLEEIRTIEPDQALGNGGLGRLAACFMESMASLQLPAYGYGIRYHHGLFKQHISDGWQHEVPEDWLAFGNPWEFERPEAIYQIGFGGAVEYIGGDDDTPRALWYPAETVRAEAYDTPVTGWRGRHVNTLRLWSARANDPIHLYAFNQGDFVGAMAAKAKAEAISKVLYPSDATPSGQELRLRQEYFFTSASLQDLVRRHLAQHKSLSSLPEHAAIQLNDTHPAIAVAELMRIAIDEHELSWDEAWRITTNTLNYTNHTLLPEALESWPVELMSRLLPRHMQIIYVINWNHLKQAEQAGVFDPARVAAVSLIQENREKRVRMGHLAFIGSHKVNGVSALHTDLLRKTVFRDLDAIRPGRIVNKTNGISFRRWLLRANPRLTRLMIDAIGERMLDHPDAMRALEGRADDKAFQREFAAARHANKQDLAKCVWDQVGVKIDTSSMVDVQIKRIHEYKRQLLNLLETVALYQAIRKDPQAGWAQRVKIIAGKAAANYARAKLIIKLAHDVARVVNADPVVGDKLKLVFLPNYNVSLAEAIIPAADLSEQISTAGMEASGTGNMKLGLNGALTIGTLDGANIEILEHVGAENIFIFGLTADQVEEKRRAGFTGQDAAAGSPRLAAVLDSIAGGYFSPDEKSRYHSLVDAILIPDHFMVAADFDAYWQAQRRVDELWKNPPAWWRASILNAARMAYFSSDRAIAEYASEIWGIAGFEGAQALPRVPG
jgi:starch phosphorylase